MVDPEFVSRRTAVLALPDGARVRLRPVVPGDKAFLAQGFRRLSAASRYRRFMTPLEELDEAMLRQLTELDYVDHFAWLALLEDQPRQGVGVARYVRLDEEPGVAEAAVTVIDEYQGRGIGTLLLEALGAVALENGIGTLRGYVLDENRDMRKVLDAVGARVTHEAPDLLRADVDVVSRAEALRGTPLGEALRALARGEASG
jgi:GNAT superfamily N-acetyltransferase